MHMTLFWFLVVVVLFFIYLIKLTSFPGTLKSETLAAAPCSSWLSYMIKPKGRQKERKEGKARNIVRMYSQMNNIIRNHVNSFFSNQSLHIPWDTWSPGQKIIKKRIFTLKATQRVYGVECENNATFQRNCKQTTFGHAHWTFSSSGVC